MRLFFVASLYLTISFTANAEPVLRDTDTLHMSFREVVNRQTIPTTVAVQMEFCAGIKNEAGAFGSELQCEIIARSNPTTIASRPSDKTFLNIMPATDSPRTSGKKINDLADTLRGRLKGDQSKAGYIIAVTLWEQKGESFVLQDRQFSPAPPLSQEPDQTHNLIDRHVLVGPDKQIQSRVLIVVGRKQ